MNVMLTPRLMMRELDRGNARDIASMMADPRVNEFFYGFQKERSDDELLSYVQSYFFDPFHAARAEYGAGGFALYERQTGSSDPGASS